MTFGSRPLRTTASYLFLLQLLFIGVVVDVMADVLISENAGASAASGGASTEASTTKQLTAQDIEYMVEFDTFPPVVAVGNPVDYIGDIFHRVPIVDDVSLPPVVEPALVRQLSSGGGR